MALLSLPSRRLLSVLVLPVLGFATLLPLTAQEPDPNAPPAAPPAQPPAVPQTDGGDNAAQPAGGAPVGGGFGSFNNAQVVSILDLYESLSGKRLIRDVNLNGVSPVNINGAGLNKQDFLDLIEQTLLLDGVSFVPVDAPTVIEAKTVKVLNVQTKSPAPEGAPLITSLDRLPKSDAVVSYYMTLQYISPQEAISVFQGSIPAGAHPYGTYVAAATASAVFVTENASVIRKLVAMKDLIDIPPAHVATEFVQLNRADAEKVADLLNKMLDQPSTGSAAAGGAPAGGNAPPPPPQPPSDGIPAVAPVGASYQNEKNLLAGTAKIFAVPEKNQIIVITRPINLPFLKQVINQLDQPDTFIVPKRRPLKYVLAEDILPAIEIALAVTKEDRDQAKSDTKSSTGTTGSGTTGGNNNNTQVQSASSGGSSSSGASSITPQLSAPKENNAPTVVSIGKTRLLADNRSNSIIVFGSPDVTERVFSMIDELDRRPLQVYLATVIGQLTISNGEEFGVDWIQKYVHYGSSGNAASILNTSTTSAKSEPGGLTAASLLPLVSGLSVYGTIAGALDYYVKALATTERFKVISRPSVYTTNNKLAVIASGSQVPVPANITSGFTGSSDATNGLTTTSSINYQNVLLQLDIIPLINADHEVTLKIRQTNDSLGKNNLISGNQVPTIITQEINTEVTVKNHQTVVIGGLISDTTDRSVGGVPYLMDIPVLGYLFSDTTKSKDRDELIIMIQPSVVETELEQFKVNEIEKQRTILGREAEEAAGGFSDAPGGQKKVVTTTVTTTTTTGSSTTGGVYNSKTGDTTKTKAPVLQPIVIPSFSNPNPDHPDVTKGHVPPDAPVKTQ